MNSREEMIEDQLVLADVIAFEYSNIPGSHFDDIRSEARIALLRAVDGFDSQKGDLTFYAARTIRNALNTLYAKQMRLARMFPKSLDEATGTSVGAGAKKTDTDQVDPRQEVMPKIRQREAKTVLNEVLKVLSPRERIIIEEIRKGESLAKIGSAIGVSKQAIHKTAHAAFNKLKVKLKMLGYRGVASDGLLRSDGTRGKSADHG